MNNILDSFPLIELGNVKACDRLMEYDRHLLEHIGGQFIVLESRATPGVQRCKVAIREKGVSTKDLIPAHLK